LGVIHIPQHEQLDARLLELSQIAGSIEQLSAKEQELRKEIFGIIENEGLTDGYKNSIGTVSYVERKNVKIADEKALLEELSRDRIVKYYKEVPAHLEFQPEFTKDVKAGTFKHPSVSVETSSNLSVRFNK